MTPKKAIKVCEDDVQCAGFSYQGAKNLEQKFSMKFFHYIPEEAVSGAKSSRSDWTWTSYKVSRTYVLLNLREEDAKKDELADSQEKVEFLNALNPAEKFNINLQNFDLQRCLDKKATKSKWMMKVNLMTEKSLMKPKKICIKEDMM